MKKIVLLCISLILFILFVSCSINNEYEKAQEEYFYTINTLIKDVEFSTAKVSDSKIIFYDDKQEIIDEMAFVDYNSAFKIMYIRKNENAIRFVCSGDVDDEKGIVFINDDSNNILDGIKQLDRIGGNSYKYSTYN